MKKYFGRLLMLVFFLPLWQCHSNSDADVSKINVSLHVLRFENDLIKLSGENISSGYVALKNKYPGFLFFYEQQILGFSAKSDTETWLKDSLVKYLKQPYTKMLYDTNRKSFLDFSQYQNQLTEAFRHFKFYFPEKPVPTIITFLNGPRAFTIGDSLLAIGLDNYFGSQFPAYEIANPPIPQFIIRKLRAEYITPDCMHVMATNYFPFDDAGKKLLDGMVYNGKIIYFISKMCPQLQDSLVSGFSGKSLDWCNNNEADIWNFFINHKLLYSVNEMDFNNYLNDAPNTAGMPPDAPGNIGSWVGWQIVKKYMNEHPEVSLAQLMQTANGQIILQGSGYKPER
jgi:hypothetical protein